MGVTLTTSAYVINNRFSTTPCDVKIACGKYSTIGYGYFVMQSNTISDGCGGYYEVGSEVNENLTTGYTNGVEYIKLLHVQSGSQNIWISQTTEELIELCKCTPTNFTVVEDNGDGTYTAYMPDGTSVTWTGATGTSFTGIVNDFASLPAANLHTDELWYVINTSSGNIGGTYYSTGTAWITPLTLFDTRISNLENNELKITYYAIVSGASGTITPPTGATFNSDEFGNSGNSILSKINGANKPTFESPKTSGGVVVTANLNTTTGAWVASGTYTDTNVALIYSINIKEKDYSNLNNFYIIDETKLNGGSSDIVIDTTPITGGGSGRILFESATGKVSESAVLSYIGGNVGIGTSAPLFPVDVTGGTGDNDIAAEFTAGAYSRGLMIGAYNSEGAIYSFNTRGTPGSRVLRVDGGGSNIYFGPSDEIKASGGKVGVGNTGTLSAKFHVLDTTEQLRIGYDASNYAKVTVGSTGLVTYDAVGSGAGHYFADKVLLGTTDNTDQSLMWIQGAGGLRIGSSRINDTNGENYLRGNTYTGGDNIIFDTYGRMCLRISSGRSIYYGTTYPPPASVGIGMESTTQGIGVPSMTGVQAEAISGLIDGIAIHCNNGNGVQITSTGFWGYTSGSWTKF